MSKLLRIAVIPCEGIGTEVVPEGLLVLDVAASAFDLNLCMRALRRRPG